MAASDENVEVGIDHEAGVVRFSDRWIVQRCQRCEEYAKLRLTPLKDGGKAWLCPDCNPWLTK